MPSLWNADSLSSNHSTWSSFNYLDPIRLVLAVLLSISLFLIPLERKVYSEGLDHLRERLSPRSAGRKGSHSSYHRRAYERRAASC
jgi:hypothetical protein